MRTSLDSLSVAVIVGCLPLLLLPELPGWQQYLIVVIFFLPVIFLRRWRGLFLVFIFSTTWSLWQAKTAVERTEKYADTRIHVTGKIIHKSMADNKTVPVLFRVVQVDKDSVSPFHIRVTPWEDKNGLPLLAGQEWALTLNVRALHGRLNQGGFDRQRWGFAQHQTLTGRVEQARFLKQHCAQRLHYLAYIQKNTESYLHQDVLLALAFGERELMSENKRNVLQKTGTAHLMAISGLHITLAAFFGWGAARAVQLFFPLRHINTHFPQIIAWSAAMTYIWLSGANPPAMRAGMALTLWWILSFQVGRFTSWQILIRVVACLLLYDPLMILSDSFWLSCSAVAALIFWYQWAPLPERLRYRKRWLILRGGHLQFGMLLLLIPLQVLFFQGFSISSLPANMIAVPIVSFITVPLVFCALLSGWSPSVSYFFWSGADLSLEGVFFVLSLLNVSYGWLWVNGTVVLLCCVVWFLFPVSRLVWWRYYPWCIIASLTILILLRSSENNSTWRLTMLDIGHGLAIVIEKDKKAILYDTGGAWETGSMAKFEILPYLRFRGVKAEQIIISHQHQDHMGGLNTLLAVFPDVVVRSPSQKVGNESCRLGDSWQWNGLDFTVLWPPENVDKAGNAESCVIRIDDGIHSVLLTGDLEKAQEYQLVEHFRERLKVDILQVPHHGSRTSSTPLFLRASQPAVAMVSTARYNPWHLPAAQIRRRYQDADIAWWNTAHEGQVTVLFSSQDWQIVGLRQHLLPRWYHQWFGEKSDNR